MIRRCRSKIPNTWSGHRAAQIDPEKCRKIDGRQIRFRRFDKVNEFALTVPSLLNLRQENMSLLTQVLAGGYGTHLLASRQFALAMPRPVQVCLTVPLRG
jgi:hypothetical protein